MATLCVFYGGYMVSDQIKELISKKVSELGYDYLDVSFKKENGTLILRITVDKDDAISLEDIVKVNEVISPIIDEADLIKDKYMLDVTSLGAEKPIKLDKLEKYVDKYINIHLLNPYKGENYLEGTLLEVSEKEIVIELKDKARKFKVSINRDNIDKARLAIKF